MKPKRIVVVGQGYVGLPIAMRAVEVGFDVIGVDTDENRVAALREGDSYVEDVPTHVLAEARKTGRFRATSHFSDAANFDFAVITVPTPLRETLPDLSYIESATEQLAHCLTPGATVVLESTTYPGTTEELMVPILEEISGLKASQDFYAGYSPERIDPGNTVHTFVTTPKIVSGLGDEALRRVDWLYSCLVDRVVPVGDPKVAELTKLLENTFRHVNIALVNELAVFAKDLGIDVWEAIEAADTKPFGYMKFTPGPGVGGHCLPVDPSYLSWQVRRTLGHSFRFVELANEVNDHMPDYVVQRLTDALNDRRKAVRGSQVVLLGLAYKKNTGDARESPAVRVAELLRERGAVLSAVDRHVHDDQLPAGIERIELDYKALASADAVVLLTDHDDVDYDSLMDLPAAVVVLDTRNRLSGRVPRL
jgi:nucleotide sugar dehydrogenase